MQEERRDEAGNPGPTSLRKRALIDEDYHDEELSSQQSDDGFLNELVFLSESSSDEGSEEYDTESDSEYYTSISKRSTEKRL